MSAKNGNDAARQADADAVNHRFAGVQAWGVRLGLILTVGAFALYLGGVLPGMVPLAGLPARLGEDAVAFASHYGVPTGWAWLGQLRHGDTLSLLGLMSLVLTVPAGFVALLPLLARHRDWTYVLLVVAQLAVFALAASGGGN